MRMRGEIRDGELVLTGDGLPVEGADRPEVPDGYEAVSRWVEDAGVIRQVWTAEPTQAARAGAAMELAQITAKNLPDADALRVSVLYPVWSVGTEYAVGERVQHDGALYRVLQAHTSQADWAPDAAVSLFARVLTETPDGPSDTPPEWVQPDSTNPYKKGDRVTHAGKTWVSLIDNNVWEPGASWSTGLWEEA